MAKILKNLYEAKDILQNGGIVVAKTDTLYGILADAFNQKAVEKVYKIKKRNKNKPFIVLIPNISYLKLFGVKINPEIEKILKQKGITVILPVSNEKKYEYLHRGKNEIAFRIPDNEELIKVMEEIKKPLIAPSANPENKPPAKDINEAINYFGNKIDVYIDSGKIKNEKPSSIVRIKNNQVELIREGNIPFKQILRLTNLTRS